MNRCIEPIACALVLAAAACNRHDASPAKPAPSAAPPKQSTQPVGSAQVRCRAMHSGTGFVVGDRSAAPRAAEASDADIDEPREPFAVEFGTAAVFRGGFAVGVLATKGRTRALIALVDRDGEHGKAVDLGVTHGGQDAPRVAARGDRIVAAVPDSDASGREFRLAAIHDAASTPSVVWGAEQSAGGRGSDVFAVELGDARGILVWDGVERGDRGVIRASTFANDDVSKATPPRVVSPEHTDAATPALTPRPGGFWLAWIAQSEQKKAPHRAASKAAPSDALLGDPGQRRIEIVPLDADGGATAAPIVATPPAARVLAYDLAPLPNGGALIGWRDDAASPGVEGGAVRVTVVAPDGSLQQGELEGSDAAAGIPALLADPDAAPPKAPLWVSVEDSAGVTLLGAASAGATLLDALAPEPAIGHSDVLAAAGGRLLISRPEHLAAELVVLDCRPGPPPGRAPAAPSSSAVPDDDTDPGSDEAPAR